MSNFDKKIDNSISGVRSFQDMSFNWLGTADFGRIVPFHVEELLPTDKVTKCAPRIEMQMLPLASPTFGKMDLYVHYFFVPTRLVWADSYDFFSETGQNSNVLPPYFSCGGMRSVYTSANYKKRDAFKHLTSMGLPPFFGLSSAAKIGHQGDKLSALPLRAYHQIWWDFYRDPELIPDSQRGQYLTTTSGLVNNDELARIMRSRSRAVKDVWFSELFASNGVTPPNMFAPYYEGAQGIVTREDTVAVNRQIEALTRMAERLSLSGKRQIDRLFAKYGVRPEWSKINMCQYLGGAKSSVLVADITSSADTTSGDSTFETGAPLGQKAGQGYCAFNNLNIKFTATEPGYLFGVFSVMPKMHFVQGMDRKWYRNSLNDFFRRELEHVGQVAVAKKEVGTNYANFADPDMNWYGLDDHSHTFAFTQPYYDYKHHADILAGDFMYYHQNPNDTSSQSRELAYMESMGMYADYASTRNFDANDLSVDPIDWNNIFYYLGGSAWNDVDDHFHLNVDVNCIINRPMDGYAIPTIETTENPHASVAPIGTSTVL